MAAARSDSKPTFCNVDESFARPFTENRQTRLCWRACMQPLYFFFFLAVPSSSGSYFSFQILSNQSQLSAPHPGVTCDGWGGNIG